MSRSSADAYLDSEERAESEQKARNDRIRLEEIEDITVLMGSRSGRRFVARQLEDTGVYRPSFALNTVQMAQNEGNRRVGIDLRDLVLLHCPDLYIEMEKERLSDGK
jgi:hypothetical protein